METALVYEVLEGEIKTLLDKHSEMVLATSANDHVTARMVSVVHRNLRVYFQTDRDFVKYQQIIQNPSAALCVGNIQIEGVARALGHWREQPTTEVEELYKHKHPKAFERYGSRESQVVIEVEVRKVTLWKYEGDYAVRDFLDTPGRTAVRECYAKVR